MQIQKREVGGKDETRERRGTVSCAEERITLIVESPHKNLTGRQEGVQLDLE